MSQFVDTNIIGNIEGLSKKNQLAIKKQTFGTLRII